MEREAPILTAGGKTAEIFFPRQPISAAQKLPGNKPALQQQAAGLHHVVTYLAVGLLRMFVAISAMLDGAEDFQYRRGFNICSGQFRGNVRIGIHQAERQYPLIRFGICAQTDIETGLPLNPVRMCHTIADNDIGGDAV